MLEFEYTALEESSGQKVKSTVKADSESAAAALVAKEGLSPLEIKLKGNKKSPFASLKNRINTKDKVLFSRQLSTLISAGLPLVQSLRTVQEQTESKPLQIVISSIIADVEAGKALAEALKKHPEVFNVVYVSLVESGETSGTLDKALERLAEQQEKDAEIVSKIRGAMVYPGIVLFVIIGVVIFMLTTVLPQVEQLYDDLGQSLPFITKAMLFVSKSITGYWWLIIMIIAAIIFFGRRYFRTDSGIQLKDSLKMNMPLFGKLFMKMYMARWTRTGGTLMSSGVPMLEMMKITGNAVNNVHIKAATDKAAVKVKAGTALSDAIKNDQNFLILVPQMINIGEQSGNIDAMMIKTSVYYEAELDKDIKALSTTIEPIMMVFLAIVAGLMVGAILMPVYGLVGQSIAL